MSLLQLIILALVQGITEFLPISSSAHLILVPYFMQAPDQGPLIDVAAHFGTLLAILLYFRKETLQLTRGGLDLVTFKATKDRQLFLFLAAATIPLLVFGGLLAVFDLVDRLRSPMIIGIASIFFGLVLWWADKRPVRQQNAPDRWHPVMMMGVAQMLSLIPGTSRSGITMTAARAMGYSRKQSARFSMLMAIPAILAFAAYAFVDLLRADDPGLLSDALFVAVLSFLSALGAISLFLRAIERIGFLPFVIYRLLLGVVLIAISFGFLTP